MRLVDLAPRWISETRFAFRCPHCQEIWLTCQTAPSKMGAQCDEIEAALGDDETYVPCEQSAAWSVTDRSFETMSVQPSLNAAPAGHWHGFITNGNIVTSG